MQKCYMNINKTINANYIDNYIDSQLATFVSVALFCYVVLCQLYMLLLHLLNMQTMSGCNYWK